VVGKFDNSIEPTWARPVLEAIATLEEHQALGANGLAIWLTFREGGMGSDPTALVKPDLVEITGRS
jgi:hypothetical protein